MAFDSLVTKAIETELKTEIEGGKIAKIYQPFKSELLLQIRAKGKNKKLLLSSHPTYARVHLTNESYDNPSEPPMFCMLLRKHLEGSFIEKIEQVELDRMIVFHIQSRNEIGDITYKKLIVEMMGRHSNIILVEKDKNMILDSIKHVPLALSRHRTIQPGHDYIDPPAQGKTNPFGLSEEDFLKKIDFNAGKMDQQLVDHFAGISPQVAKEIVHLAGFVNRISLPAAFFKVIHTIEMKQFAPQIMVSEGREHFHIMPFTFLNGEVTTFATVSEMLDRFYFGKADRDRVKQQATDLERLLKNEYNKNEKKIKKLEKQLIDAKKADQLQLYGELLTANLYAVKRGDTLIEVDNYYDETGGTITIELDPRKTPSENAQSFFQKYQKLKNSVEVVKEQIELAKNEMTYLDTLMQQIKTASPRDIEEIRTELVEEGYLKKRKTSKKNPKQQKPVLEQYMSSDGLEILVGKNNKQNEYLTNKLAHKSDTWLHTKDIPGSHVVIRHDAPPAATLTEAAIIAAYFSKARDGARIPVDFTQVKHVKKPNGAKPGFVIYDNQTTLFVTPDEDLVRKLKKRS